MSGLGPAERFARSCRLPPGVRNCCYAIEQVVTRPVVLLTVRRPLAPRSHRQALQQPRMMQPRRHGTAPAEPAQRSAVCVWPRSVWGRVRVLFRPASPLAPRGAARVSRGRSRDESGRVRKTGVARGARGQRTRATWQVPLPSCCHCVIARGATRVNTREQYRTKASESDSLSNAHLLPAMLPSTIHLTPCDTRVLACCTLPSLVHHSPGHNGRHRLTHTTALP